MRKNLICLGVALAFSGCAGTQSASGPSRGFIAVSANDNKAVLVNGAVTVVANPAPDTVAVIDLRASPPRVIAAVEAGAGVAGISINRKGNLALAANRSEGTVSVFEITGKTLRHVTKVPLGDEKSGPSSVAITPDGRMALVSRDGDSRISVLSIDGTSVQHTKRDIFAGQRPYGLEICAPGDIAVVANIGLGQGDSDTISVIDLKLAPPRVIDTLNVGQTPEGISCSPNGRKVAVVAMSGSNKSPTSPFYRAAGRVVMFNVDGRKLTPAGEADIGNWSQGAAFSADGRTLLVQNMVQKNIFVFEVDTNSIRDTGQRIPLKGGGAGIRTSMH